MLGGGAMVAMPLAGLLIRRVGSRVVMVSGALVALALLPVLATAPGALALQSPSSRSAPRPARSTSP